MRHIFFQIFWNKLQRWKMFRTLFLTLQHELWKYSLKLDSSEKKYLKNLWRRKCVRRAIFRNVEVRVEVGYFVCNTSHCVTVRPVRGHLAPKMNIAFFIRNLTLNIFLFNNFFEKSCIFRKNRKKMFWGCIWQFFRDRRCLTPKINITFLSQMRYRIFYYLPIFSKNV